MKGKEQIQYWFLLSDMMVDMESKTTSKDPKLFSLSLTATLKKKIDLNFLELLSVYRKIEQKVEEFPYTPLSHCPEALIFPNVLPKYGTFD